MSGKQLCPAYSKGMNERSSGSAAASGQRVVLAPRAAEGRARLPFLPGRGTSLREAAGLARAGSLETAAPRARGTARKPGSARRRTSVSPLPSNARAPASGRLASPQRPEFQPWRSAISPSRRLATVRAGTQGPPISQFPAKTTLLTKETAHLGGTSGSCARRLAWPTNSHHWWSGYCGKLD